jgi:cell fate regulator YaaT (PSP1 superfamily)
MAILVGIVLSEGGQVLQFDPSGLELAWNERVICQTGRGREYGRVVQPNHEAADDTLTGPPRRVIRRASTKDEEVRRRQRDAARAAMRQFKQHVRERGIPVKPYAADATFDGGRIMITYGAEDKTDLRSLAGELSHAVGARVDLRQVGPREGARLVGGGGMCGDQLCCTRFPSHENPITLRMAKDQELPMNPGRITGLCGRLRCCLAFEHPVYRSFRDRAPAVGRRVTTPRGRGVVRSYQVPLDRVVVRLEEDQRDEPFLVSELTNPE